jgi:hypothetical protein
MPNIQSDGQEVPASALRAGASMLVCLMEIPEYGSYRYNSRGSA